MGISTYNYNSIGIRQPYFIDSIRAMSQTPSVKIGSQNDVFIRTTPSIMPEVQELERLFPNNEIYKIYDDIVKEYGLENPPKLNFINQRGNADFASASHITNKIDLNLAKLLSPNMYKFLIEKDGELFYSYDKAAKRIRILDTENQSFIKDIIQSYKLKGADNCQAVKLSDDDKRKFIIQTLAHELEHCYQNQIIRHTEGLDHFNMLEKQIKNNPNYKPNPNLIEEKLAFINLKKMYLEHYSDKDFEKKYAQGSAEGQKALECYNASINYINAENDYEGYEHNALELDANIRGNQYLKEHYGDFEGISNKIDN